MQWLIFIGICYDTSSALQTASYLVSRPLVLRARGSVALWKLAERALGLYRPWFGSQLHHLPAALWLGKVYQVGMHSAAKIRKLSQECLKQVSGFFFWHNENSGRSQSSTHSMLLGPILLSSYLYYPWHEAFILVVEKWLLHLRQEVQEKRGAILYQESKAFSKR